MGRWRDIKNGNPDNSNANKKSEKQNQEQPSFESCASIAKRIKAFIVDMFMIMMPLAYLMTYVLMDGKDDFQGSQEARWAISIIYGLIIIFFWIAKGQTPGQKAYDLILVDAKTKEKVSLPKAIFRYVMFLFSAVSIILAFLPFVRRDKKTFQDLIANTLVLDKK